MTVHKNQRAFMDLLADMDAGELLPTLEALARKVAMGTYMIDRDKVKGSLVLEVKFEKIAGTGQLMLTHKLKSSTPSRKGSLDEVINGQTAVHVSIEDQGAMTIMPESQFSIKFEGEKE